MAALSQGGNDLTPEQFDVLLNGLQAMYCDAAAAAIAATYGVIYGRGTFTLSRLGGTVDKIDLNINMDAATIALADVDANAVANADAYAYAFAKEQDCSKFQSNALKFRLCALAKGQAYSDAVAEARSYASAAAVASSSASTNVEVFVDAVRINEFDAQVSAGASSFVATDARASAYAFAAAYAEALAKIKISTKIKEYHCCRHKKRHGYKVCRYKKKCGYHYDWECSGTCGWWTTVFSERFTLFAETVSRDIEESFARALAESLAAIDVNMSMRAYFKDLPGQDIVLFRSDNSVAIDAATQCFA